MPLCVLPFGAEMDMDFLITFDDCSNMYKNISSLLSEMQRAFLPIFSFPIFHFSFHISFFRVTPV